MAPGMTMMPGGMTMPGMTMAGMGMAPTMSPPMGMMAPPSYAPQMTMMQQQPALATPQSFVPQVQPSQQSLLSQGPALPVKLTQGVPTTDQIDSQKKMYAAALEKQLRDATDQIDS